MERFQKNVRTFAPIVAGLRSQGKRIVMAVGVFDLLHPGHVRFLADARSRGDYLVVAIQSDTAARKAKGAGRPLLGAAERAEVLLALSTVDYVTVFDAADASALLKELRPDVVARGRDTAAKQFPERAAAEAASVEVLIAGGTRTYSSSQMLSRGRPKPARARARA